MSLISLSSLQPSPQYGIVLDAGSSHTAMYIYKWPADKQNGTGVVTQHTECHPKGKTVSQRKDSSRGLSAIYKVFNIEMTW